MKNARVAPRRHLVWMVASVLLSISAATHSAILNTGTYQEVWSVDEYFDIRPTYWVSPGPGNNPSIVTKNLGAAHAYIKAEM